MTYEVRILARAENDLIEIRDFIARDSPANAQKMVFRLIDRIQSLDLFPSRGAVPRDALLSRNGYRFLVEEPYLIFYKIEAKVLVYRVLHSKRAYERIL